MKEYILYAGVNGAGKSTLYNSSAKDEQIYRVNMDEITRSFGSWKDPAIAAKAAKIAVQKIHDYTERGVSFNQESTLCGHFILRTLENVKKHGYKVALFYVGLDSSEIAKERVRERVLQGGHGIPEEDIERRYTESFQNIAKALPYCDCVYFYDNSEEIQNFAELTETAIYYKGKIPKWYRTHVEPTVLAYCREHQIPCASKTENMEKMYGHNL